MKKAILILGSMVVLSGCATPTQNFLAGAAGGAIVATSLNNPPPPRVIYVPPPRPVTCYNQYVGRDQFGRVIYNQICR